MGVSNRNRGTLGLDCLSAVLAPGDRVPCCLYGSSHWRQGKHWGNLAILESPCEPAHGAMQCNLPGMSEPSSHTRDVGSQHAKAGTVALARQLHGKWQLTSWLVSQPHLLCQASFQAPQHSSCMIVGRPQRKHSPAAHTRLHSWLLGRGGGNGLELVHTGLVVAAVVIAAGVKGNHARPAQVSEN